MAGHCPLCPRGGTTTPCQVQGNRLDRKGSEYLRPGKQGHTFHKDTQLHNTHTQYNGPTPSHKQYPPPQVHQELRSPCPQHLTSSGPQDRGQDWCRRQNYTPSMLWALTWVRCPPQPRPGFSLAKPQRMCFWAYPPQASTGPAHLPHHLLAVLISQLPNPRLLDPSHVHTSATHPQPHLSPPLLCPTRSLALHSCCPPSAHTAVPSIVPPCAPTPPCPSSSALLGTACLCHHPKSGGGGAA